MTRTASLDELLDRVVGRDDCWLWTGPTDQHGRARWKHTTAHRVAYLSFIGPIPAGHKVTTTCEWGMYCINPDHLVTTPNKKEIQQ